MSSNNLPFRQAFAIQDRELLEFYKHLSLQECLWDSQINIEFCEKYAQWITGSKLNSIKGLEKFHYKNYSNGTSESFVLFYIKNKNRRFRCFKGEYMYHQLAWRNDWPDWKFIDDEPLDPNDAVVISLPFSDTGNEHHSMKAVLEECEKLEIPVLIDCAYFGICKDIDFNFDYECVTDVVFSLSKTFPVAHARIGMRFSKVDDDDLIFVYNKMNYTNRLGAKIGLSFIENFDPEFVYLKYRDKQEFCCQMLNLQPSNTVIFGIDSNNAFDDYNRGTNTNRLSLNTLYTLEKDDILNLLK